MSYLLIIKTGSTVPDIQDQYGDFDDWMVEALEVDRSLVQTVDVSIGEDLPDYQELVGIIITGSHAMVTEQHPWSEACAGWLRVAAEKQIPILGICFGHQLLAYALGGTVDYMPEGREVGTLTVHLRPEAQDDPLLHGFPSQIQVQLSHRQAVMTLPPDVVWLGQSDRVPHQAFRYGDCVWGMQFHPEFSVGVMEAYTHYAREGLVREGFDPEAIARAIQETPMGLEIMQRFASLVF
jgi:GMP synthase (glutamine-hydrolysing)